MPARLSGADAISPAIERTKRQLFAPFRFAYWWRVATLCLLTGELTGGGGGNPGSLSSINLPSRRHSDLIGLVSWPESIGSRWMEFLPWILVGVAFVFALAIVFVYLASVFRFVLFETVVYGRCELMAGWRRWQRQGNSYFLWLLGFGLASLVAVLVLIGGPVYLAWEAGIFSQPGEHIALLVIGGVLLIGVAACVMLVSALGALFAKDFVVPVMALEDVGVLEGWRRVFPMLAAEKLAYTIYVLVKIALAVGSALLFAIIDFVAVFAILIPVGIVAVIVVVVGAAAGLTWNTVTISVAVVAGGVVLTGLLYLVSFISAPAMVFFQAYSLHFFGSRYPRLGDLMVATSPPPKPSPPLIIPSTGGPLPAT